MAGRVAELLERARWAQLALVAAALLDAIAFALGLRERSLLAGLRDGDDGALADLESLDTWVGILAVAQLVVYISAAVFFIRWFLFAYRNVGALGVIEPRYRISSAWWSWFIPVFGYFRPKQIANDIWWGSDADARPGVIGSEKRSLPWFYLPWWLTYVASQLIYNYAFRRSLRDPADDSVEAAVAHDLSVNGAYLVADVLSIVAAVLAILVVRRVTARQRGLVERRDEAAA